MPDIFGVDFGTTNSAVVGLSYGQAIQYGDEGGQPYPSVVAIDKFTGDVVAHGRDAWAHQEELRDTCEIITSVKMSLETPFWNIGNRSWTPEQVVSEIFSGLKGIVRERGTDITSAVVAIPVGFSPENRRRLRKAAEVAGVNIRGFISEPTAAVYRNYDRIRQWQRVAVFDWGGGTLDIAVVDITGGLVTEIAKSGTRLGGDDLDRKLASWAHKQVLSMKNGTTPFDEMPNRFRDELIVKVEEAKRTLSTQIDTQITHLNYGVFGPISLTLNAETFSRIVAPELDEAVKILKTTIRKANIAPEDLGCILMVGGSSKLQGLFDKIQEACACEVIPADEDSDWAIAHGAALLNQDGGRYVIAQDVGVILSDDTFYPMFTKGEEVHHVERAVNFGLVEDSDNARFVFVEKNCIRCGRLESYQLNTIGHLSVPTFGFVNEPIRLTYRFTEDLVMHTEGISEQYGEMEAPYWDYEKVLLQFRLPNIE